MDDHVVTYTLLAVEDDPGLLRLMTRQLQHLPLQLLQATTARQALQFLDSHSVDLMLLDYKLPDMDARQIIQILRQKGITLPFVVITGHGDEQLAVEMMKSGARDYLMKEGEYLELLPSVVKQVIEQLAHQRRLAAAENALRQSEAKYRLLFENMATGFAYHQVLFDDQQKPIDYLVLEINSAFEKIFSVARDDLVGKPLSQLAAKLPPGELDWVETCSQVALTGTDARFERYFEHLERWLFISAYSPRPQHFAILVDDISDRRLMEEELRDFTARVERSNRELEHFAGLVSHGLQDPLADIRNHCQWLREHCASQLAPAGMDHVEQVCRHATRMQRVLSDMRACARVFIGGNPFAPVDLNDLLRRLQEKYLPVFQQHQATCHVTDLPVLDADPEQLETLFTYLIDNALRFRTERSPRIEISAQKFPDYWQLQVADNGAGISPEKIVNIFNLSQSRRGYDAATFNGSGISLSICHKIVERHGGRIWCESQPGFGATFFFTFPAKSAAPDS